MKYRCTKCHKDFACEQINNAHTYFADSTHFESVEDYGGVEKCQVCNNVFQQSMLKQLLEKLSVRSLLLK